MLLSPGCCFSSLSYATYLFISEVRNLTESCLRGFLCSTEHLLRVESSEEVRRNSRSCLLVLLAFSLPLPLFFFIFLVCAHCLSYKPCSLCHLEHFVRSLQFAVFPFSISACVCISLSLFSPPWYTSIPPPQHTHTHTQKLGLRVWTWRLAVPKCMCYLGML